jgi:hypothetical protein
MEIDYLHRMLFGTNKAITERMIRGSKHKMDKNDANITITTLVKPRRRFVYANLVKVYRGGLVYAFIDLVKGSAKVRCPFH